MKYTKNGALSSGKLNRESLDLAKSIFHSVQSSGVAGRDKTLTERLGELGAQLGEFEQLLASSLEELHLEESEPQVEGHSGSHPLFPLDFRSVKENLKKKDVPLVCAILKALRWRVSRAENVLRRRETIIQFTSNNLLEYPLFAFLLDRKNRNVTEHLLSLVNTIASEYQGRSYLIESTQLIKNVIQLMRTEITDSFVRRNCLGFLQKLSLRKKPQEILIQSDVIKWALSVLSNERTTLSAYSLNYTAALILNLSLRTVGKNKFEEVRFSIMSFLRDYMAHPSTEIRTYVNGTMYSLFSRPSLRALAIEMGFEDRLRALIETADEEFAKRYNYVLKQLLSDGSETTLSELNEDERDCDLIEEEEFWVEDENENAPEVEFEMEGERLLERYALSGEEAERQLAIISTIMDETINQSRLEVSRNGGRRREDDHPRPSTPFKSNPGRPDGEKRKPKKNEAELSEKERRERAEAFKSRPKLIN